ncbi:MAG: hemolysin family protein [Myxococcota bacterium]
MSVVLVLVTSFFCSLSEASLLSSSRARLHSLRETSSAARLVEQMKNKLDRPIAAILILNTVANTGGAAIAGREFQRTFDEGGIALFTTGLTIAVLVFAELLPKTLGVRYSMSSILLLARPLHSLTILMSPLTFMVERMTEFLGGRGGASNASHMDDLRAMVRLAVSSKAIGPEQQSIMEAAAQLPRLQVRQLMIHRHDIVYLSLADDDETLLRKARQSMHSRLLLCRTDLDSIVGVLNIKEVLWRLVSDEDDWEQDGIKRMLGEAVRENLFVPESLDASKLLQLFSREHEHIAVVQDRGKRTVGIVTLEDVIEELVGEIDDEYDKSPVKVERVGPGVWHLGGGTLWKDAAAVLKIPVAETLPEDRDLDGRYDLNDLAADRLPGKLRSGASFVLGPWRFKVLRMRRGKVLQVEAAVVGQGHRTAPTGRKLPV